MSSRADRRTDGRGSLIDSAEAMWLGLAAFVAVLLMVVGPATIAVSGWLGGAGWGWPSLRDTVITAAALAAAPGVEVPPRWAVLAAAPWLPALVAVTLLAVTVAGAVLARRASIVRRARTRAGSPAHREGLPDRTEIAAVLSSRAIRPTAAVTRPSLSEPERRCAPLEDLAVPMHRLPARSGARPSPTGARFSALGGARRWHRERLWVPLENPTGALAPTQSGKTRTDLVHKALDAPGPLLVSTTKPDLVEFIAAARSRRPLAGPVWVLDLTGQLHWPARPRWSPVADCTDLTVATARAHSLVGAAAAQVEAGGGDGLDRVFQQRAEMVMAAYFVAAAHHGGGVEDILRWVFNRADRAEEQHPVQILESINPELSRNLKSELSMNPRTADGVWMSVRRMIEPWLDPMLRWVITPQSGAGLDMRSLIGQGGTLCIVADPDQTPGATPLLTALVGHWISTARAMAPGYPNRRVEPPATAVLDELTTATPLPTLPKNIAKSAGEGVLIHWAAQSLGQLHETYGQPGMIALRDNTTCLSVWGGIKDPATLEWVSTLSGHYSRERRQSHTDGGALGTSRASWSTEDTPVLRPADVRELPRGNTWVIYRDLPVFAARTIDVSHRPDWPTLQHDRASIRNHHPDITPHGYRQR